MLRQKSLKYKTEVFAVIMATTGDTSVIKNKDATPGGSLFDHMPNSNFLIRSAKDSS